ncbi:hypothetical protein GF314_05115, partial [bacterium]|nr:hypothetical protein [bacterium]
MACRSIVPSISLGLLLSLVITGCGTDDDAAVIDPDKAVLAPGFEPGELVGTRILDGETDPHYPEDDRTYPYYIVHRGPQAGRYPFQSGDRVPDGATVVFKAIATSDEPAPQKLYLQGRFDAEGRIRGDGPLFQFGTTYSTAELLPGWFSREGAVAADTISFEVGPFDYTVGMRGVLYQDGEIVDRDQTPAELSFSGNHPPCVQCLELGNLHLEPDAAYADIEADNCNDAACLATEATLRFYLESDPRLDVDDPTHLIARPGAGTATLWVHPELGGIRHEQPFGEGWVAIPALGRSMVIAMHGKDHPQEPWRDGHVEERVKAWRYQVDYAGDPENRLDDGGGRDDIDLLTGLPIAENAGSPLLSDLYIDEDTGVWGNVVAVAVPAVLVLGGAEAYWQMLRQPGFLDCPPFPEGGGEDEILAWQAEPSVQRAYAAWRLSTVQLTPGTVRAMAVDQTTCEW